MGLLEVSGPGIFREYQNNAEPTAVFPLDGWLKTGDDGGFKRKVEVNWPEQRYGCDQWVCVVPFLFLALLVEKQILLLGVTNFTLSRS